MVSISLPRSDILDFAKQATQQTADNLVKAVTPQPEPVAPPQEPIVPPEPMVMPDAPPIIQTPAVAPGGGYDPSSMGTRPSVVSAPAPPSLADFQASAGLPPAATTSPATAPAAPDPGSPPSLSDFMQSAGLVAQGAAKTVAGAVGDAASAVGTTVNDAIGALPSPVPTLQDFQKSAGLLTPETRGTTPVSSDSLTRPLDQPTGDTHQSQFGLGLSDADAAAACGPAAAIGFARATGRNPTTAEAMDLARSVGWTPDAGMAGVQSEKALLDKLGVASKLETTIDWNHVQQDSMNGNTVILDTPGHYYYLDGARQNAEGTVEYHVGTSGSDLKGGTPWMTQAAINGASQSQGSVRAALYADNPNSPHPSVATTAPGTSSGVAIPDWLHTLITDHAPPELAKNLEFIATVVAGAKAESGWDPSRVQQGGGGRGLFQFDVNGGMGAGLPDAQLFDPAFQAAKIIPQYAAAWAQAPANLSGAEKASWVAAQAEKPYQYDDPNSTARRNYAAAFSDITGGGTSPNGATGTSATAPVDPNVKLIADRDTAMQTGTDQLNARTAATQQRTNAEADQRAAALKTALEATTRQAGGTVTSGTSDQTIASAGQPTVLPQPDQPVQDQNPLQRFGSQLTDAITGMVQHLTGQGGQTITPMSTTMGQNQPVDQAVSPVPAPGNGYDPSNMTARSAPTDTGIPERPVGAPLPSGGQSVFDQAGQAIRTALDPNAAPLIQGDAASVVPTYSLGTADPLTGVGGPGVPDADHPAVPTNLELFQKGEQARRDWIDQNNPIQDPTIGGVTIPGVRGASTMVADIATDPLTYLAGGPISSAAEGIVARLGLDATPKIVQSIADQLIQGGGWGAMQGVEDPNATPGSVLSSTAQGAALGGAGGIVMGGASAVARNRQAVEDVLRSRSRGEVNVGAAMGAPDRGIPAVDAGVAGDVSRAADTVAPDVAPAVATQAASEANTVDQLSTWLVKKQGPPGISIEPQGSVGQPRPALGTQVVFRDTAGNPQGILSITNDAAGKPDVAEVAVNPAFQRQGIATSLYDAARQAGLPIDDVAGRGGYTADGAALANARRGTDALTDASGFPARPPRMGVGVDQAAAEVAPAAPETSRFYHGTGSDFATTDATKFDPNGLFGPGYYLTDSPVVAGGDIARGGESVTRGYLDRGGRTASLNVRDPGEVMSKGYAQARDLRPGRIWSQDEIDRARAELPAAEQRAQVAQRTADADPNDLQAFYANTDAQAEVASHRSVLQDAGWNQPAGGNVRAVDVPKNLNLLNVDAPLADDSKAAIQRALQTSGDPRDGPIAEMFAERTQGGDATGQTAYDTLSNVNSKFANDTLARAGFDGIQYNGGRRIAMQDAAGNAIQHTAVNIFPESLQKLRNATSGTMGGFIAPRMATTLGGAAAGGLGANQATDPNDPNRLLKIGVGAAAGGVAGFVGGGLFDRVPRAGVGTAVEDAARTARLRTAQDVELSRNPFGLHTEPGPGRVALSDDDLASYLEGLSTRYEANDARIQQLQDDLTNRGTGEYSGTIVRPSWGAGWTDDALRSLAKREGLNPNDPTWGSKAADAAYQSDLKGTGTAQLSPAAARAEMARLTAENEQMLAATEIPEGATTFYRSETRSPEALPFDAYTPGDATAADATGAGQSRPGEAASTASGSAGTPAEVRPGADTEAVTLGGRAPRTRTPTYDELAQASPDLQRLRAGRTPVAPVSTAPLLERMNDARKELAVNFVRGFTDRQVDVNHIQETYAKHLGRPLNADEMAAELQRFSADGSAAINIDEGLKPAVQAVGKNYNALVDYVTARSNVQIADNLGNDARKFSGGVTKEDSQRALQTIETNLGPEQFKIVKDAADQVSQFSKDLRARLVDSGVLSQEQAAAMEAQYPDWAKTRILDYMKDPAGGQGAGTKIGLSDNNVRAYSLEGTEKLREDPIASTVAYAHQVERMAMKNEAFTAMLTIDQAGPNPMLRKVAQDFPATKDQVTMIGFVDGQKVKYVTDNKALGEAINGAGVMSVPEWAGAWQKVFRSLATSRNPLFLAGNAALDIPTAAFRTAIRDGGPLALPGIMVDMAKGYADAFRGLLQGEFHGEGTIGFLKGGGGQSGYFTGSEGETAKTIAELRRKNVFQINGVDDIKRLLGDAVKLNWVEGLGERVELGPRVMAYNRALKRGANATQAVTEGRTVTVDFSQGGTVTKYINNFIPFFNVSWQGPVQIARAWRDNPKAFMATTGTLIGVPTIAAEVWNRSDPQRAQDYKDVPDYVKNQGVVIMWAGDAPVDDQGNRQPGYTLIKLREWSPFSSIARDATARVLGDDSKSAADMLVSAGTGVMPMNATSLGQFGTSPLAVLPIAPAAAELAFNKDFFRNKDIVTQRNDDNASTIAKTLAPILQAGVDRSPMAGAEVRPSAIDFLIRDQGAGVGAAAIGVGDLGQPRQDNSPQSLPVVGGLIGRFSGHQGGQINQDASDSALTTSAREILRSNGVNMTPAKVSSTVSGVPLRYIEQTRYQQLTNRYVDDAIHLAPTLAVWKTLSADDKTRVLEAMVSAARQRAGGEVLKSLPPSEINARVVAKTSAP